MRGAAGIGALGVALAAGGFASGGGWPQAVLCLAGGILVGAALRRLVERNRISTMRAGAAAERERQRRLFETALSNTADFNYIFDLSGRFVFVNTALLALWGKTASEAVGRDFHELGYPPELATRLLRQIREVIDTRRPVVDETPFESALGVRQYEYIFQPVLGADGKVEAVAGSTRDITDRARAEQALRAADARKDEFLATLAHELRNPLAPIRNALQIMRVSGGAPAAMAEARAVMERQLGHMVRLVDDLLDISRITGGKMELRKARVALASVIANAVETARPLIDAHGHRLAVSLPAEPVLLDADQARLAQVFWNLLNNSAKYTPPGGAIRLDAEAADGMVAVRVRDTGMGIPAESLPTIFEMFSQVESSLDRAQGGLGIGLALVKGIVGMHGGTVSVASEGRGKGAEFTVTLPLAQGDARANDDPPAECAPQARAGRRILVVDDNRDSAASLSMLLSLMGNEVRTAGDGLEGVELAAAFRPEVVLMDIGMPRLNGFDACRRIRQQPGNEKAFLVACTGWGQEDDRRRTREAGFDLHLVKPLDPTDVESLLAALDGR